MKKWTQPPKKIVTLSKEYAEQLENALSSADEHIRQLEHPAEPEPPTDDTVPEANEQDSTVPSASVPRNLVEPGTIPALVQGPPWVPIRTKNENGLITAYEELTDKEKGEVIQLMMNASVLRIIFEMTNNRRSMFYCLGSASRSIRKEFVIMLQKTACMNHRHFPY